MHMPGVFLEWRPQKHKEPYADPTSEQVADATPRRSPGVSLVFSWCPPGKHQAATDTIPGKHQGNAWGFPGVSLVFSWNPVGMGSTLGKHGKTPDGVQQMKRLERSGLH